MIVVCGEALVDLVAGPEPGRYVAHPGGGPANTAVALARLGTPVAMLARLGSDRFGQRCRTRLADAGVDLRWAVPAEEPTTLAVADLDAHGSARYRFYTQGTSDREWRPDEIPPRLPPDVVALHAGTLSLVMPPAAELLIELLRREARTRTVSVDPNVRPDFAGLADYTARMRQWLPLTGILKLSEEDVGYLRPGVEPDRAARQWVDDGVDLVVVTRGARGSLAACAGGVRTQPAADVRVVDTIGAGDSFAAGLLDWLHRHGRLGAGRLAGLTTDEVGAALAHATRVAAVTCGRPGADPPWAAELTAI